MYKILILLTLASVLLLTGCTEGPNVLPNMNTSLGYHTDTEDLVEIDFSNSSELEVEGCGDNGNCVIFACKGTENFFGRIFDKDKTESMLNDECKFITAEDCVEDTNCINETLNDYDGERMFYMIGEGSSFGEMQIASWYLNTTRSSAIKWLEKKEDYDLYYLPERERAEASLRYNNFPIYVVPKSNKSNYKISGALGAYESAYESRVIDIVNKFSNKDNVTRIGWEDEIGPVMIFFESPDMNYTNEAEIIEIAKGIRQTGEHVKEICPNCLVGVIPPKIPYNESWYNSTEYNVSETFLDIVINAERVSMPKECENWKGNEDKSYCFDIIGEGTIMNNLKNCDGYYAAREVILKSRTRLNTYQKPSFLLYVGGKRGKNIFETCEWNNRSLGQAYNIYFHDIPNFVAAGTIGMHACNFNDAWDNNPHCNHSNYSLTKGIPEIWHYEKPEAIAWLVNHYGNYKPKEIEIKNMSSDGREVLEIYNKTFLTPIIFSDTGFGLSCFVHSGLEAQVIDVYYGRKRAPTSETYSFNDSLIDKIDDTGNLIASTEGKWKSTIMPCAVHNSEMGNLQHAESNNGTGIEDIKDRKESYEEFMEEEEYYELAGEYVKKSRCFDVFNYSEGDIFANADNYDVDPYLLYAVSNVSGNNNHTNISKRLNYHREEIIDTFINQMNNYNLEFDNVFGGLTNKQRKRNRDRAILYLTVFSYFNEENNEYINEKLPKRIVHLIEGVERPEPGCSVNKAIRYYTTTSCREDIRITFNEPASEDMFNKADEAVALYYAYVERCSKDYDDEEYNSDPDSSYFKQCVEREDFVN